MIRNRRFHPVHDELDPLLNVADLRRQRRLPQLHARPRLVDQVDRLVRQIPVGNESARSEHRGLDRVVGVHHGVEFLVPLLDPEQNPARVGFVRRRHLHCLEPPLQRAVLFDRFAKLAWRRRPDALDLAARQRRLQNVGRVQRSFGRARAHQRVQFVDEDDGVLVLHQLLHDCLEPLFKLAAVFRPRHDQTQVQRQNPFIGQKRRHVAIGDPLRESFHNRSLAHARLADQHRVVLRPPAQNLHHPLQLVVPPDQRIQLPVRRRLRQVATELRQQRALLGPACRRLLHRRPRNLLPHLRQPQPALVQDLSRKALLFSEKPQQQVLRPDVLMGKPLRFLRRKRQHLLALVAQRQIDRGRNFFAHGRLRLDLLADRFDVGL